MDIPRLEQRKAQSFRMPKLKVPTTEKAEKSPIAGPNLKRRPLLPPNAASTPAIGAREKLSVAALQLRMHNGLSSLRSFAEVFDGSDEEVCVCS